MDIERAKPPLRRTGAVNYALYLIRHKLKREKCSFAASLTFLLLASAAGSAAGSAAHHLAHHLPGFIVALDEPIDFLD